MTDEPTPACLDCGACCFSRSEEYVRVDGDDYARLGDRVDELTQFFGIRCYMRMVDGHCAALVLDAEGTGLLCSIYETRPGICRELERASNECRAEIHEKGDRPAQLLVLRGKRP